MNNQFHYKVNNPNYSLLNDISTDITEKAYNKELMNVFKRKNEMFQIEIALTRKNKNNVVLLGPSGVGKSAIIEGLAMNIVNNKSHPLKNKRILQFSINDLIETIQGDLSLGIHRFIDEIHMIGKYKYLMDELKTAMARGNFRIIGATTHLEWQKYIAQDQALVRRFEKIDIQEPNKNDTLAIVKSTIASYDDYHQVNYEEEALKMSIELGEKYFQHEVNPDLTFIILYNTGAICRMKNTRPFEVEETYQKKL